MKREEKTFSELYEEDSKRFVSKLKPITSCFLCYREVNLGESTWRCDKIGSILCSNCVEDIMNREELNNRLAELDGWTGEHRFPDPPHEDSPDEDHCLRCGREKRWRVEGNYQPRKCLPPPDYTRSYPDLLRVEGKVYRPEGEPYLEFSCHWDFGTFRCMVAIAYGVNAMTVTNEEGDELLARAMLVVKVADAKEEA